MTRDIPRRGLIGALVLTMGSAASHAAAEPLVPAAPVSAPFVQHTSLREAVRVAAIRNSRLLTQSTPPRTGKPCGEKVAIGGLIGAGAGVGFAFALLASSGGSDEARRILVSFGSFGALFGLGVGAATCAR